MDGPSNERSEVNDQLVELYELVRRAYDARPRDREEMIAGILGHSESILRLENAGRAVLNSRAERQDLLGDLMQDASTIVAEHINVGSLTFHPEGPKRFGGWLFTIWLDACRTAWQRKRRENRRNPIPVGLLDQLPDERGTEHRTVDAWNRTFAIVRQMEDPLARAVMFEWLARCTAQDSAASHEISEATVSRLRTKGFELIEQEISRSGID